MSTRGTYLFKPVKDSIYRATTCVYVHYDSYPSGAAAKFYRTLCMPSKGDLATQFIRAVDEAEITTEHSGHGDTEYRYTVVGTGPDANIEMFWHNRAEERRWVSIENCQLHEFVDRHKNEYVAEWSGFTWSPFRDIAELGGWCRGIHNVHTVFHAINTTFGPVTRVCRLTSENQKIPLRVVEDDLLNIANLIDVFPELEGMITLPDSLLEIDDWKQLAKDRKLASVAYGEV